MSLNPWSRLWFILDKIGVYYLRGTTTNNMERVKVCDIVLCTVRETNEKTKGVQGLRYCFEIITPNSRPYMLQAVLQFFRTAHSLSSAAASVTIQLFFPE